METIDSNSGTVLVVDDDPAVGKVLIAQLAQAGIACRHAPDAAAALVLLGEQPVDVVITDLRMPGASGLELLEEIVRRWPEIPVILLTAHGSVGIAVEAMKKGAADFLLKPFDREEILFTVRKQIAAARHADQPPAAEGNAAAVNPASSEMREVQDLIRRAAGSTATVLIRGESGTGKELAARAIHDNSPRRNAPFVKIQCAALPDTLIESELFGYEKGAFTGAASRKPGRVELAEGGTLFLDEIGDVTPVDPGEAAPAAAGSGVRAARRHPDAEVDVPLRRGDPPPLEELIKKRGFREDLFYRLNVLPIWIPALRARAGDVESLARHFCRQFGEANGRGPLELEPDALALLQQQAWPGNVRELQNFIERLVVLSDGATLTAGDVIRELARRPPVVTAADAPPSARPGADGGAGAGTLEASRRDAEREAIVTALDKSGNNRSKAARLLGISRRGLYHKLGEHGLL